jgi:hypothetical protein
MKWLFTLVGAAVVLIVLRAVFHTLWHPPRHGGLSRFVMTLLWRLSTAAAEPAARHGVRTARGCGSFDEAIALPCRSFCRSAFCDHG